MLITRRFVWRGDRPADTDEIDSATIDRYLIRDGVRFRLRLWDVRYPPGKRRVTEAVYDEVRPARSV